MKILVTGATGYIGGRLVPRLLETGHEISVLVRKPEHLEGRSWSDRVEVHKGDLFKPETLEPALRGVDVVYYLIHSMSASGDFEERDRLAAQNFVEGVKKAGGVKHVIYLGGIQPAEGEAQKHLRSRAEVGSILAEDLPVTELRAGPIIGSGSASFELVRYLTERLPVMVTPKWVNNVIQPIGVRDILAYLLEGVTIEPSGIIEVGAPPITFKQMMLQYAEERGLKRVIIPLPVLTPKLAALWIGLVTPISTKLGTALLEGIVDSLRADTTKAEELFPHIQPMSYRTSVQLALQRLEEGKVETRWSGSPSGSDLFELEEKEGLIRETHTKVLSASPESIYRVFSSAGGKTGWFRWNALWRIRGFMDALIGGPGLRRGRRSGSEIYSGESIDFWRVEKVIPYQLLRLQAEMKVPGRAWLQWETRPLEEGSGTELKQTAIFAPKGLWGMLYWWGSYPFHLFIFRDMINEISRRACELEAKISQGLAGAGDAGTGTSSVAVMKPQSQKLRSGSEPQNGSRSGRHFGGQPAGQ